jgi:hypothetical protein
VRAGGEMRKKREQIPPGVSRAGRNRHEARP